MKQKHRNAQRPPLSRRVGRVFVLSLMLSIPTLLINLLIQGGKEFRSEIETCRKYRKITQNMKREDR
ncbi:hypothetical protein D7X94_04480 [Acutalibacter sp. 1XD8-33]|uniref:hypothetical protein n=1 Tax=Acutalibacter sp. 1XD8-33 TaxID=2320081 RepID=UPI000EA38659|nr:hypothetical protein [Acutalibacter sp. 1XD8-33]RKJ41071.1 hypothetical protein D7X94_04480 [Acutalibacter sp. 1XD8-33]